MRDIASGTIVQSPNLRYGIVQYLDQDRFCILGLGRSIEGGNVLAVITDPSGTGRWVYTLDELKTRLKEWQVIENRTVDFVDFVAK